MNPDSATTDDGPQQMNQELKELLEPARSEFIDTSGVTEGIFQVYK